MCRDFCLWAATPTAPSSKTVSQGRYRTYETGSMGRAGRYLYPHSVCWLETRLLLHVYYLNLSSELYASR